MLNSLLRPSRRPSAFVGGRYRVIFCRRVTRKKNFHAFSLRQVVQINVEYIQNLLRLIKDAYPHGMPHLNGSLAANLTSTWNVYTNQFSKLAKNDCRETPQNCPKNVLRFFVFRRSPESFCPCTSWTSKGYNLCTPLIAQVMCSACRILHSSTELWLTVPSPRSYMQNSGQLLSIDL